VEGNVRGTREVPNSSEDSTGTLNRNAQGIEIARYGGQRRDDGIHVCEQRHAARTARARYSRSRRITSTTGGVARGGVTEYCRAAQARALLFVLPPRAGVNIRGARSSTEATIGCAVGGAPFDQPP